MMVKPNTQLGSAWLLTGTCIGAGMLTLPLVASPSGLIVAIVCLLLAWLFMFYTGLLTLEANLSLAPGSNYISMTHLILGPLWRGWTGLTIVAYVLMCYALISAYLTGIIDFIDMLGGWSGGSLLGRVGLATVVTLITAVVVAYGLQIIDYCNRLLLIGLVVAFAVMMVLMLPHAQVQPVWFSDHIGSMWFALPILMTSFGYQILIPSIRVYMASHTNHLRRVIFWGCSIPCVMYLIWLLLLFTVLPTSGAWSLPALLHAKAPELGVLHGLASVTQAPLLTGLAHVFIVLAILTSLLGIAVAMMHFFRDEIRLYLHVGRIQSRRSALLLTFLPPWLFACFYPHGFLLALRFSGIFVLYLHGLLPALMVWQLQRQGTAFAHPHWSNQCRWLTIGVGLLSIALMLSVIYALAMPSLR